MPDIARPIQPSNTDLGISSKAARQRRASFTQAELMRAVKVADKATKAGIPTKVWVESGCINISVLVNAEENSKPNDSSEKEIIL
jgi:hypothetical protein